MILTKMGKVDPIVSYYEKDIETVYNSKDELTMQLPYLKKKYLTYKSFANASFKDIFGSDNLNKAEKKYVYTLETSYFVNIENNNFKKINLPFDAQVSTVHDIFLEDFNDDGFIDILLTGNNYQLSTNIGRLDGLHGLILLNDREDFFEKVENLNLIGEVREVQSFQANNEKYFIFGLNSDSSVFFKKKFK